MTWASLPRQASQDLSKNVPHSRPSPLLCQHRRVTVSPLGSLAAPNSSNMVHSLVKAGPLFRRLNGPLGFRQVRDPEEDRISSRGCSAACLLVSKCSWQMNLRVPGTTLHAQRRVARPAIKYELGPRADVSSWCALQEGVFSEAVRQNNNNRNDVSKRLRMLTKQEDCLTRASIFRECAGKTREVEQPKRCPSNGRVVYQTTRCVPDPIRSAFGHPLGYRPSDSGRSPGSPGEKVKGTGGGTCADLMGVPNFVGSSSMWKGSRTWSIGHVKGSLVAKAPGTRQLIARQAATSNAQMRRMGVCTSYKECKATMISHTMRHLGLPLGHLLFHRCPVPITET